MAELIAGEAQDHQPGRAKLAMERLQPLVLGGETAATGHVDHQNDLALQGVQGKVAAIEPLQSEGGKGHGGLLKG
ncbi:hypothetical protein D3C81_2214060 [compost metagenome]